MTPVFGVKDILLGRGAVKHIANRFFRTYIDLYVYDYFHSTSREEKCRIIEESLYELDLSGYRFLKENYYGEMMILDPKSCRSKIAHALRDRCLKLKNKANSIRMVKKELDESGICAVHYAERLTNGDIQRELAAMVNILPKSFHRVTKTQDSLECRNLERERRISADTLQQRLVSKSNCLNISSRGIELSEFSQGIHISKDQALLLHKFSSQNCYFNATSQFLGTNHSNVKSIIHSDVALTARDIPRSGKLSKTLWSLSPIELCTLMQSKL